MREEEGRCGSGVDNKVYGSLKDQSAFGINA